MFRLLDIPWWYYAIAVLIGVVVWRIWRWEGGLYSQDIVSCFLLRLFFIRLPFTGQHFQPELFWSWKEWDAQKTQIFTNIIMFILVGVLTGLIWKWKGLLVAGGLSLAIGLIQFVSQTGLFEFDDALHNSFGALIGLMLVLFFQGKRKRE